MTPLKVIDISYYDTITDWSVLAKNVDGIIVRAGYRGRSDGTLTTDKKFKEYIEKCIENKIPVSIYFFSQAINEKEGIEEAEYALKLIDGYKINIPIFIDTELSGAANNSGRADGISVKDRTDAILGFCKTIENNGYNAGIYASDSWFKSNLDMNRLLDRYVKWVAKYSDKDPVNVTKYIGWQYTETGKVDGISGECDISYWYEELSTDDVRIKYKVGDKLHVTKYFATSTDDDKKAYKKNKSGYIIKVIPDAKNPYCLGDVVHDVIGWFNDSCVDEYYQGKELNLSKESLYVSSDASSAKTIVSGTYYIWDNKIVNNRIRITKNPNNCGIISEVNGWINIK